MNFKKIKLFTLLLICAFAAICSFSFTGAYAQSEKVYLGGMPAGFILDSDGAIVIGLCEVVTCDGTVSPAKKAEISTGDRVISLNSKRIVGAEDIETALEGFSGDQTEIEFIRNDETLTKTIYPAKDISSGKFKIGLLVRDNLSGIGTITYIKEDGRFGALGHPVFEETSGKLMNIGGGNVFKCSIIGVNRGEKGKPGELKGIFFRDEELASIDKNCVCGIFGKSGGNFKASPGMIETAGVKDVKMGKASIFTTIDGSTPKEYEISVVKIDKNAKDNKNMVIKITDKELLNATNGILQGMSGSPIVQNGKLIGAVTHVFVNDPTRGYGISIDKMLCE